jgi:glycosyltransferase involved in cell wall biosynthesis
VRLLLDPMPIETPRVLFDVTRLLRSRRRSFGTGVDRIDLAIGLDLASRFGADCGFVCDGLRGPVMLRFETGMTLLNALDAQWSGSAEGVAGWRAGWAGAAILAARLTAEGVLGLRPARGFGGADATYVNASHSGLPCRPGALARLDPSGAMRRLAYLHDLIPLDYPEYQRPGTASRFERFLAELLQGRVSVSVNSQDTGRRVCAFLEARGRTADDVFLRIPRVDPATIKPDGAARRDIVALASGGKPYFLSIGTIEPRKNHLLLLNLWRAMAAAGDAPTLALLGRRGWENEMVLDMLDRCPAVRAHVVEIGDATDAEIRMLLGGCRALLAPSFAEGLGVPLLEAAASDTPVIASDLPAHREIAPQGSVFLDPLDGPGWRREIMRLAAARAAS